MTQPRPPRLGILPRRTPALAREIEDAQGIRHQLLGNDSGSSSASPPDGRVNPLRYAVAPGSPLTAATVAIVEADILLASAGHGAIAAGVTGRCARSRDNRR